MGWFKNLFGKQPEPTEQDYSSLVTDLHSHLLPGIDDGSQSVEESLELIRSLKKLGFKKFVTTPHVMSGGYDNTPETIKAAYDKLIAYLAEQGEEIELQAAAEYYFEDNFLKLIEEDNLLSFSGKHVLFELPNLNEPQDLEVAIFNMTSKGYKPVLAHVERYPYLYQNGFDRMEHLRNMGVLLQVNIATFGGVYKRPMMNFAFELAEKGMVDLLGSDTHQQRHIGYLQKALEDKRFLQMLSNHSFLNSQL